MCHHDGSTFQDHSQYAHHETKVSTMGALRIPPLNQSHPLIRCKKRKEWQARLCGQMHVMTFFPGSCWVSLLISSGVRLISVSKVSKWICELRCRCRGFHYSSCSHCQHCFSYGSHILVTFIICSSKNSSSAKLICLHISFN